MYMFESVHGCCIVVKFMLLSKKTTLSANIWENHLRCWFRFVIVWAQGSEDLFFLSSDSRFDLVFLVFHQFCTHSYFCCCINNLENSLISPI